MNPKWYQRSPESIPLDEVSEIIQDKENKTLFPRQYQDLILSVQERIQELKLQSKEANPLAWFQPSYEQHLKLNAWIYGINYIVDFDANRTGKTAGAIINALLWIIPNEDEWLAFQEFQDKKDRQYKCIKRPTISTVKQIQETLHRLKLKGDPRLPLTDKTNLECLNAIQPLLQNPKDQIPNPTKRTIWNGGPDSDTHKEIVMPEWLKWTPAAYISKQSTYDQYIELTVPTPPPRNSIHPTTKTTIIFKSYDSKDTKWSGAAVDAILLTEGPPRAVFNEVRQRYKSPAFASWDYTPYEPRNTGQKSALAHKVFSGDEPLPLTPYIFTGFGIKDTPDYILPEDKRDDLLRMWEGKPEGQARIHGNFYTSSPIILKNYDDRIHSLSISFADLRNLYSPRPLILFRGIDPGWGHVTGCAWMALAPDNTKFIYRFYSRANRSIEERCTDIIKESGNTRIKHPKNPHSWIEKDTSPETHIRITFIDYHSFKTDETTKSPFALNYFRNGLFVRKSLTHGPKERAELFNDLLLPQHHLPHPITKKPPGSKVYFLTTEPGVADAVSKMKNVFWQTFEKGEKRGLTKETPQDYDDDELDAASYVLLNQFNYSSFFASSNQGIGFSGASSPVEDPDDADWNRTLIMGTGKI